MSDKKSYKFAGEDEHMFHVKHPDGSTFGIAKSAVGPGVHKMIKGLEPVKMADGGFVPGDDASGSSAQPSDQEDIDAVSQPSNPMAEKQGILNHYQAAGVGGISGGPESRADSDYDELTALRKADPGSLSTNASARLRELEGWAGAQERANTDTRGVASVPANDSQAQGSVPQNNTTADISPQEPTQGNGISDAYVQAFAQKEAGIKGIAGAQEQAGKEQAEAYKQQADQIAQIQANYQKEHAQIDAEHKQLTDAVMNDKIDPNRLYHSMGTGNKILAAISVALSGIGSGMSGQQNMAMGVIQKSIDRDIDAQKAELGKKHTLLSENLRRYGDLNTATQMTQLQMNAITQAKVAQIAARSGSAQAAAQAQGMLGELGLQSAQIKQQMAMKQAALKGGGDPSGLVQYVVPPAHQKAVFDEIQRAQDTRRMGQTILKSFDDAAKENTILKTGAGYLRTPPAVLALHQSMQPTFKDLEGTVRQAAMDNTFKNITPAPGDLESSIKVKRKALEDYLQSKAAAPTAKGFGIDLDKFSSTTTQQAPPTKTVNGITYMRGPNGQAIPVK